MARKGPLFLDRLHPILSQWRSRRSALSSRLLYLGLALLTALSIVVTPAIAKDSLPPPPSLTSDQQAQQLYAAGRYTEAIAALQQSLQTYQQQNDRIGQAIVLSNLSLNYQRLGTWTAATQTIEQAIKLLQTSNAADRGLWAQALDVQGSLQLARGQASEAVTTWQQAATLYRQMKQIDRAILSQINQAQALQTLGLNRRAFATLQPLDADLTQLDAPVQVAMLRSLGDALRVVGNLDRAKQVLQQSQDIARKQGLSEAVAMADLSLGNVALAQSRVSEAQEKEEAETQLQEALDHYTAAAASPLPLTRAQALLNRFSLLTGTPTAPSDRWQAAAALYPQLQQLLPTLPPGRAAVDVQIGLARQLMRLRRERPALAPSQATIAQILATALQQAKSLNDPRSTALALGHLGRLYEQTRQWSEAESLTQQALVLSQSIAASDIAYRWQWQLGRVLRAQNQFTAAITAYTEAYNTLQGIRRDLATVNVDVQFSFRENVEPVYRQLVGLLLQPGEDVPGQKNLQKAREVLETLQVADLENFLQSACQDSNLQIDRIVDQQDRTAAVIYPILLEDRLEVILKLPGQALYRYPPVRSSKAEIQAVLQEFQENLRDDDKFIAVQQSGQLVYNWLIQPVREQLDRSGIKTLIFVLDEAFRNVSMAGLYDGKHYLVENYGVSLQLGLQVRDPLPLRRSHLEVLAASLTDPPPGFDEYSSLANVNPELDQIQKAGVLTTFIRDKAFTRPAFGQSLNRKSFQVVHLATHGQFGADLKSTYILAADGAIQVDELSTLFRHQSQTRADAIELLVLSACKTAAGNNRAVLGIAGTVVRSGAQSAIAGLWSLADESSVLFTQTLYQNLGQPQVSRSEALRRAQSALLKDKRFAHPRFWAPYVLVGSWL